MADVTSALQNLQRHASNAHYAAVRSMQDDLSTVNRKTGKLAASRRVTFNNGQSLFAAMIAYPLPQANWTDKGTRPHMIYGRPTLRFVKGGKIIFARRVQHPGNKPFKWWSIPMTQANWRSKLAKALAAN